MLRTVPQAMPDAPAPAVMGLALIVGSVPLVAVAFVIVGLGIGTLDVLINVEGAAVERAAGRTLMPMMHAAWSIGVAAGAGIGAACAALGVSPAAQLIAEAVLIAAAALATAAGIPGGSRGSAGEPPQDRGARLRQWLRGGGPIVDRLGRVRTIRVTTALGVVGVVLFILAGNPWIVLVGVLLWAVGVSMGFPLGMSAAAESGPDPAARVSVVASIGYFANLAGPPAIGVLAQSAGLLNALWLIVALFVAAFAAAGSFRPRPTAPEPAAAPRPETWPARLPDDV